MPFSNSVALILCEGVRIGRLSARFPGGARLGRVSLGVPLGNRGGNADGDHCVAVFLGNPRAEPDGAMKHAREDVGDIAVGEQFGACDPVGLRGVRVGVGRDLGRDRGDVRASTRPTRPLALAADDAKPSVAAITGASMRKFCM